MKEIEKSHVEEVRRLHGEILNSFRLSLEKGIRIGELLTEQKEALKHGEFTTWVNENLPFTDRTARNYMRVYHERDKLKTESVSDLKGAYEFLIEHKKKDVVMIFEELVYVYTQAKDDYSYETDERLHNLFGALKPGLKEEINNLTDIEEAVKVHRLARQLVFLASERSIHAEVKLGEALNELSALGVHESVWLTPGGLDKLRGHCEKEIERLSQ